MSGSKGLSDPATSVTTTPSHAMHRPTFRPGLFRFSGQTLLGSLIFLLVALPFLEDLRWGRLAGSALFSLMILSALLAVGGRRGVLVAGLLVLTPALVFHWLYHLPFFGEGDPLPLISMALAVGFTAFQLLRFILRARKVDSEVLCAAISVYLLAAMLWAEFYLLVDITVPASFSITGSGSGPHVLSRFNAIYFSFATLTTSAFGDIVPASRYAKSLASLESVTGVLYIAVLISRLVSLYQRSDADSGGREKKEG